MLQYYFILEPYNGLKSRFTCPNCGAKQSFTKYINLDTKEYLFDNVGRCNKEEKCNYHYTPKQYFDDNKELQFKPILKPQPIKEVFKEPDFINVEIMTESLKAYDKNNFISFLKSMFSDEVVTDLIQKYYIGTSKKWNGATVFWQIDKELKIHTGKIMLYNPENGKRIKEPYNHFTWVHKAIKTNSFNLKQCLFGLHLINNNIKPIALVESEKTAIISSIYLPQFIWLATGGLNNLSKSSLEPLKGRKVILYPDLGAYDKWKQKEQELKAFFSISISDILEQIATKEEKLQGFDIADYLIKMHNDNKEKENEEYTELEKQIVELERRIAEAKQYNNHLEQSFNKIATETEFYKLAPYYVKHPNNNLSKIKELIYWTS